MQKNVKTNVPKEIYERRIERYNEKTLDKPKNENQLLVAEGKAIFVREGEKNMCTKVEGYVRLTGEDKIYPVEQTEIGFFFLPKDKLIILKGEQTEFLGYKSENSQGCCILVHATTEYDDILIVSTDSEVIPLISIDIVEEEGLNINELIFSNTEYLIKKLYAGIIQRIDMTAEEGEDDEWEE